MAKLVWVLFAVFLLSAAIVARAGEVEDAEHTDEKIEEQRKSAESHDRQSFKVEKDNQKVVVEMESKTKSSSGDKSWDKLKFEMEEKPYGLDTEFSYQSKSKSGDDESHNQFKFKLRAFRIREYNTTDTTLSSPVSTYYIGAQGGKNTDNANWLAPVVVEDDTTGVLTATFETADHVFKAVGRLVLRKAVVNNITLIPDLCKFDYYIHNFPYASQNNNTYLALEARFKSDTKQKVEQESSSEAAAEGKHVTTVVRVKNDAQAARQGHFEWRSTIKADGAVVAVEPKTVAVHEGDQASDSDDRVENALAFLFKTTNKVADFVWDPEVGVAYTTASGVSAASTVSLFAVLLAAIAALLSM